MDSAIASEIQRWKEVFKQELLAELSELRKDEDIYGFAVEVPEDPGNLGIATAIGRESKLADEKPGSLAWLDSRYSPVEWEFLPNAKTYDKTHEHLEELSRKRSAIIASESLEDEEADEKDDEILDALYAACLDAMAECNAEGAFGHISFKIIFMSDGEHPVIRESFHRLNEGRVLKEAAPLFDEE